MSIYVAVDVDVDVDVDGDVDVAQIGALQHWQRNGKTSVACGAASRWGEHVQHGRGVDVWCNGDIVVKRGLYNYGDNYDDASDNDGGDNDDGGDNNNYDGNDDHSAKNNSSNNGRDNGNFEVKSKASNNV